MLNILLGWSVSMANRLAKAMFVWLAASNIAFAGTGKAPGWNTETLSGDWGGVRSSLYDKGVAVELTHKSDMLANTSGGVSRGAVWLMNSEAAVSLDLDKLAGWDATSAFIQYHVQHGNKSINNYVGSFAGVDNIETGTSTGQFFQAWLQKNFADDSLSLLVGCMQSTPSSTSPTLPACSSNPLAAYRLKWHRPARMARRSSRGAHRECAGNT